MNLRAAFLLLTLTVCGPVITLPAPVLAATQPAGADSVRQMMRLIDGNQWNAAKSMATRGGRDSETLYEWLNLQRTDNVQDFDRYEGFVAAHPTWPGVRRIRANTERIMTDDTPLLKITAFYRDGPPVSGRGMIFYAHALTETGREAEAKSIVNDWFPEASLGGDEQDQVLSALGSGMTRETLQRRMDFLIDNGQGKSARAVARRLGAGYPELVEARLALADKQPGAAAAVERVPASLKNDPGLVYERMKWRRRSFDNAAPLLEIFNGIPADFHPVDPKAFWNEHQALIYRLIREGQYTTAYQVASRPLYDDRYARVQAEWFAGHIAYTYLKQPGRAFRHFETLYKQAMSPLTRARAAYWAASASGKLGYPDVARAWYRTASAYRGNFYGQLAAQQLPQGTSPYRQGPPVATDADRAAFAAAELPRIARLLRAAGDTVRAEQFIARMGDLYAGQGGMLRLTVDLVLELKLTSAAVKLSRAAAMDGVDFADYVYPTLDGVGTGDVEPALIYAIIRQESGFNVDAVSASGALGLMQLMPATAKAVAKSEKARHDTSRLTDDPHHNIRLGSAYIRQLVKRYGSYAMAAAAYNAGPGRVSEWIREFGDPRTGDVSLVDWIERIPVYETRNYVQRVIEGTAVYRAKLGTQGNSGGTSLLDPLYVISRTSR